MNEKKCNSINGNWDDLMGECNEPCQPNHTYSKPHGMCMSNELIMDSAKKMGLNKTEETEKTEKEGGKRRKKRKTRRRRKSKKSRKSRRRKGKKSRKSRRRRRRRTRKKKGGVGGPRVEGPKEDNYSLKKIGADAFKQKNLGKSYQEF